MPDDPYKTSIIRCSRSGKTNLLCNQMSQQPDFDKIYLYARDPQEANYEFLTNKRENTGSKHLNNYKVFIKLEQYG